MIALELGRGPLLRPALARAVRAAGAQALLDVRMLATVAEAADAVAAAWAAGGGAGPLRVSIDRAPGALSVAFGFPDRAAAAAARGTAGLPPEGAGRGRLTSRLRAGADATGWDLLLDAA